LFHSVTVNEILDLNRTAETSVKYTDFKEVRRADMPGAQPVLFLFPVEISITITILAGSILKSDHTTEAVL
jgi:hypothetical protein